MTAAPKWIIASAELAAATGAKKVCGAEGGIFSGVSIDTRTIQPGDLYVAIRGKRFDGHDFVRQAFEKKAAGAVVGHWPLKGLNAPAGSVWQVTDTQVALGEIAKFHRLRFHVPVAGITGSAGKTTVKAMLQHILSETAASLATEGTQNNLIGVPLTLFRLNGSHRAAVIEMGTNQWGEIRSLTKIADPTVGVLTNIGRAHLECFGDLQGVLRAKGEMWEALRPDGTLVLNAEDPLLLSAEEGIKQKIVWFGLHPKSMLKVRRIESQELGSSCLINDAFEMLLSVPGRHNLMNALAAITCAAVMGHDIERAARRMESFTGVPGRLNVVHAEGSMLIDDSYNSNPTSLRAALEVLKDANTEGRRIAVIGDMLELGSRAEELHAEAGRWVVEAKADLLVAVGPLSRFLAEGAKNAGLPEQAIKTFNDSEKAKDFVSELIKPGDTLLLKGSRGMQMERIAACFTTSSIR